MSPFFLSPNKLQTWNRSLKRKVRNIPFGWVRFLTDSVLLPEQDMKQKDTGEQDIIKSQDWLKNTKNSYMKHGWRFWSGEDYICNMQMISWFSKGVANLPLDLLFYYNLLSKTKNVWLFDTLHQKILPTEFSIRWLKFWLNPNQGHFCKRRTRFFHFHRVRFNLICIL